jgi:hypothetical protein
MERTFMIFSDFFVNFVSSYVPYVHDEPLCIRYVPFILLLHMSGICSEQVVYMKL